MFYAAENAFLMTKTKKVGKSSGGAPAKNIKKSGARNLLAKEL
jgi:hypothetical protein